MGVGTIGVMAPLYAMLFQALTPVAAMTLVVPSFFIFMASFIVKK